MGGEIQLTSAPLAEAHDEWRESVVTRRVLPEPTGHAIVTPGDADIRVLVGIPMERTIGQLPFFGFIQIFTQGWPLARLEYTRNDIARCKFGEFLVNSNYTHLLMLDSDHVHPADIVPRLARWFRAYPDEVQVLGGLNFRRGAPYDPCAFVDPGDGSFRRMAQWSPGAIEVDALGSGSMMIARSVFEALPQVPGKPWFGYDYSDLSGWPGTDMWFSKRCHEAGIALWCDTTTTSPHVGDMMIDESNYRAWLKEHGVDA
jgi:hypothetical protein